MKINSDLFFSPNMTFKDTLYFDIYGFCNLIPLFNDFSLKGKNKNDSDSRHPFENEAFFQDISNHIYKYHQGERFYIEFGYNTRSVIVSDPTLANGFEFKATSEEEIKESEIDGFKALESQKIPFRSLFWFFKEFVSKDCSFSIDFSKIKKVCIRDYESDQELIIIL